MTAVLEVWSAVKSDQRFDVDDRRVAAQVARYGNVGNLDQLAYSCHMKRAALEDSLDRLTAAGYLPTRGIRPNDINHA